MPANFQTPLGVACLYNQPPKRHNLLFVFRRCPHCVNGRSTAKRGVRTKRIKEKHHDARQFSNPVRGGLPIETTAPVSLPFVFRRRATTPSENIHTISRAAGKQKGRCYFLGSVSINRSPRWGPAGVSDPADTAVFPRFALARRAGPDKMRDMANTYSQIYIQIVFAVEAR